MKYKESIFSRNTSLLKIAGKIIVGEIKERVIELDAVQQIQEKVKLAKMMTGELGNLKGAAMKLGQLLSLDASDILPPEVAEVFSKLQKDADPVEFNIIDAQLKDALKEKYQDFKVERTPLAVASIGQVHRATFEEKNLVFKVQYPGIEKTIESDIRLLKLLFVQTSFFLGTSTNLDALFNELRSTLLIETDYSREGEKMHKAREFFNHDQRYIFPLWYKNFSTHKVLAMEYMEGISITEWLKINPEQKDKNEIGLALYDLYMEEFFNLGMVQTDPNPGNFLINSKGQIVILDFGAAKEYNQEFREGYKKILRAAYNKDIKKVLAYSIEFNLINAKEDISVQNYFYEMLDCMVSPFRLNGEFDFTDRDYFQHTKDYAINISKKCRHSPPPENIFFLHRKLGGIFQLLKKLNIKMNMHSHWNKYIAP